MTKRVMSGKNPFLKTFILVFLCALLLGVVIFFDNPDRIKEKEHKQYGTAMFEGFQRDTVSRIEISKGADTDKVLLLKKEQKWLLESADNYPADSQLITAMFSEIESMTRENLASDRTDQQKYFEVDEMSGLRVKMLATDEVVADFFMGKAGEPSFDDQYVRIADEEEIYRISGLRKAVFNRMSDDWKDKRLLVMNNFRKELLSELAVKFGDAKTMIVTGEAGYKMIEPEEAELDAAKFDAYLQNLADFKATAFEHKAPGEGIDELEEKNKIWIKMNDNSIIEVRLWEKRGDEQNYRATVSGNSQLFLVSKTAAENLQIKVEELKAGANMQVD